MGNQVPEVVILRLPVYLRTLVFLEQENIDFVSSRDLAARLSVTPAQIRKDLSYFGKFGRQGRGYNVKQLLVELRRILGLDRQWAMALVGVGRLGRAILNYGEFAPQGFRIVAAFDTDEAQIGKRVGSLVIQNLSGLEATCRERGINIAILAVPPSQGQKAVDILVRAGIKAILNYVPLPHQMPEKVRLREIDPVLALQSMTYYLKS